MATWSRCRRVGVWVVSVSALLTSAASAAVEGYYRQPTVHGETVVFNSEGDLWRVSTAGGAASRLTSHPANETWPSFSPDGKWIAFTADYRGNSDVYLIPAEGGEPRRLTFHPTREDVVGWIPDGKSVLFRARRTGNDSLEQLFTIAVAGGEPKQVPVGRAGMGSYSQDGRRFAFIRNTWFSNWKRYKGGTAPQIWVGDLAEAKFRQITPGPAVHSYPMWVGDRIYYTTEAPNGNLNVFSCAPDGADVRQHTNHADFDVRFAQTDGKRLVYTVGADLWLLDLSTGQSSKLPVTLASDRIRTRPRAEDAGKSLERFTLSDDGKRMLIGARGELWIAPAKPGGRIITLTDSSAVRERGASLSPDGQLVACISDETGEQEIKLIDAAGKAPARVLTKLNKGWLFPPVWAPDGKHLAFADMDCNLYVVHVDSGELTKVDQDEVWEIRQYTFSPDGKWLAYVKNAENRTSGIYLYGLVDGSHTMLSSGFTTDSLPAFDPQGKYLYFLSQRYWNPMLDEVDREFVALRSTKVCMAILAGDGRSPFLPEELTEEKTEGKERNDTGADNSSDQPASPATAPAGDGAATDGKATPSSKPAQSRKLPQVRVDLEGIQDRVIELPNVKPGNYTGLSTVDGKVFFLDRPLRGMNEPDDDDPAHAGIRPPSGGSLMAYNLKDRKTETFLPNITGYALSGDGKKIAWRTGDTIKVASTASKPPDDVTEKVSLGELPLMVTTAEEWKQIYHEAWRLQRDFYWASNMVGVDWAQARDKYAYLVPRAGTRGELNDVIGQLIGELGTSHTYISGGDSNYQPPRPVPIGLLGADFEVDEATGLHRFSRVYRPERWETGIPAPLIANHVNVKEGDFLLAINGRDVGPNDSVDERLTNLAGAEVLLTVASKPDKSDARDVQVKTLRNDFDLRYADLCRRNREYVEQRSSGRVGYFHLPDMSTGGLVAFIEGFYPQFRKQALVIDVRNNHGGFVSQMLLERLGRKAVAYGMARRGIIETYPEVVHVGPKVCLIDQNAGSDGDIFPYNFRNMGLGKLIGKRSWGGVVGIRSDKGFVDAGMSTQPEFAFWDTQAGWTIEGYGVDPDIEVDIRPEDELAGRDPQLDRAIDELMKELEKNPGKLPTPPELPNRSGIAAEQARQRRAAGGGGAPEKPAEGTGTHAPPVVTPGR